MTTRLSKVARLAERQNWRCCYCGVRMVWKVLDRSEVDALVPTGGGARPHAKAVAAREATIEHVTPRSAGGKLFLDDNLVAACRCCNNYRGNNAAETAMARIARLVRKGTHPHARWDRDRVWHAANPLPTIHRPEPPRVRQPFACMEVAF